MPQPTNAQVPQQNQVVPQPVSPNPSLSGGGSGGKSVVANVQDAIKGLPTTGEAGVYTFLIALLISGAYYGTRTILKHKVK